MGALFSALFAFGRTAEEIARRHNLTGKVAIVTGANTGLGMETARVLAKSGCKVYMACRNIQEGKRARANLLIHLGKNKSKSLVVSHLDLSSLKSVEQFAKDFQAAESRLDFLILNAAVMGVPYQCTKEGFEWHFGVNYLGHFFLTQLLVPGMVERESEVASRIIVLTCTNHRGAKVSLLDLNFRSRKYTPFDAYYQSKMANWWFAQELAARLKAKKSRICVFAVDPGASDTQLFRNINPFASLISSFSKLFVKTVGRGAATTIFACVNARLERKSGCCLENCHVVLLPKKNKTRKRRDLWERSMAMLSNMEFDSYNPTIQRSSSSFSMWSMVKTKVFPLMGLLNRKKSKSSSEYELVRLKKSE